MYITSPEYSAGGQMMFRENIQHMIKGKKVLILIDAATTGATLQSALGSLKDAGEQAVEDAQDAVLLTDLSHTLQLFHFPYPATRIMRIAEDK